MIRIGYHRSNFLEKYEKQIEIMKKYTYSVDNPNEINWAVAIGPINLATCYHSVKTLIENDSEKDEIQRHKATVIALTNAFNNAKIRAKIVSYSIEKDITILEALDGAKLGDTENDILLGWATVGQSYFALVGIFN